MARRDRSRLRPAFAPDPVGSEAVLCASGLVVLEDGLRWRGSSALLSERERALLALLVRHPDRLITHDELSRHAWDEPRLSKETVPSTVKRLRARLSSVGFPEQALSTVRGLGYRWEPRAVGQAVAEVPTRLGVAG